MATIEYIGRTEYTNPKAVSRVLPSIVRLTYYSGDEFGVHTRDRNGTIFSCVPDDHHHAQFLSYILTTADLFIAPKISNPQCENEKRGVSPLSKVDVWLPSDERYSGEVVACDEKLNIAVIKIKSDESLPVAMLAPFSDWISMSPFGVSESHAAFCLSPLPTKLTPGDELTIVCTAFGQTSHALVFSGLYSVDRISRELDCLPFFRINCGENCGEIINGAPVINCEGDVFGVAFNISKECVAFFPVNVFFKWWKHVLTYGEICRPWIGISIYNLYAAVISRLEAIVHDCGVYDGVFIEEVIYKSPAHTAGLLPNDVICQCDGRPVRSLLEFTELLWDKSGEMIEAKGVRDGCHFVWKIQIEAIKAGIVPEWLAKSLAENVVTNDEKKKLKKNRKRSGLKKKFKKIKRDVDSEKLEESKKSSSSLSNVPRFGGENVDTEAMRTEIMQAENGVPSEKSRKRRKNKAKDKKKANNDQEGSGSKAQTRKRDVDAFSVAADERKKDPLDLS